MSEQLQVPYRSIPDMFLQRVAATPDGKAFAYPGAAEPTGTTGPTWLSWRQVGDRASAIAAGLHGLGVQPEDRVAIACGTRVEWIFCDLGILCAGAATTTTDWPSCPTNVRQPCITKRTSLTGGSSNLDSIRYRILPQHCLSHSVIR